MNSVWWIKHVLERNILERKYFLAAMLISVIVYLLLHYF